MRLCLIAGLLFGLTSVQAAPQTATVVRTPSTKRPNAYYVGNRSPLLPTPFIKLPVGAIEPKGWIRTQLTLQAHGFHGRLLELSRFLKKDGNAWLSSKGVGDHGWEEVPYWLKGYANTAYVLKNTAMIREAQVWIDAVLKSQKDDGWFGPDQGRKGVAARNVGRADLWPNMIMLFVLQANYEYSGDERVLDLMTKYFRWELAVPDDQFLPPYWQQQRAADNLYSVYWLYNRTGDAFLLDLAKKIYRHTANWTDGIPNWHNVNMAQAFGGPTTFYMQSKDKKHLEASERNWQDIRSLYGQVPGGLFGGDENCREGYDGPRQAIETCGMVEAMLSDETLLRITGQAVWADRCENVAFNSLPAAFTADLKALRYLTAPNQVLSDRQSKSPGVQNRGPMFLMDPHGHRCCQHNSGHGWPYYAQNLWLATPGNGLAAALYAPCRVTAKVGDGTEVTIEEQTDYPFGETISLSLSSPKAVTFPLVLRVPRWCAFPRMTINGKATPIDNASGGYIVIEREFKDGDTIQLTLPMNIIVHRWEKNRNTASINLGPLTFSLKIGEKYVRAGGTDEFPALEIHPTTPWNYGLVLDEADPARGIEVIRRAMPPGQPFQLDAVPIEMKVKAKRIPNWQLDDLGLVGAMQPGPIVSDEPVETITLVPMGAARLRLSAFPVIGDGPDAKPWPKPLGADIKPTAGNAHI